MISAFRQSETLKRVSSEPTLAQPTVSVRRECRTKVSLVCGEIIASHISSSAETCSSHDIKDLSTKSDNLSGALDEHERRTNVERWGLEETRRFYAALQQYGTDFTLMQLVFPGRSQRALKNKYHREERHHSNLVALALRARLSRHSPINGWMSQGVSCMGSQANPKECDAHILEFDENRIDLLDASRRVTGTCSAMSRQTMEGSLTGDVTVPVSAGCDDAVYSALNHNVDVELDLISL